MFRKALTIAAAVALVGLADLGFAGPASAHEGYFGGYGMMAPGYGMVPGYGMGPGYGMSPGYVMGPGYGMRPGYAMGPGYGMAYGYGYGAGPVYAMRPGYWMMRPGYGMGPNGFGPVSTMDAAYGALGPVKAGLTVDDVRTNFEQWLEWQGNPRLKLGNVQADGKNTIVAEIVTKDGSLVDRYRVNRKTGAIWRAD